MDSWRIVRLEIHAGPRQRVSPETCPPKWILAFRLEFPASRRTATRTRCHVAIDVVWET